MLKFYSFILALFLCVTAAQAQNVVLSQDVNKDTIPAKFGPNRKHYIHFYGGIGWIPGISDDFKTETFKSTDIVFGMRYKRRLAQWYALGFDLAYNRQSFSLDQDDKNIHLSGFPVKFKKEHLLFHNLQGIVYQRFNFGKRGDKIGKFIDLGAYGTWTFDNARKYKMDNSPGIIGADKIKFKEKDLNYIENINYGVTARIGNNRLVLYSTYRLSNLIKENKLTGNPDLPPLAIGLQIGFH